MLQLSVTSAKELTYCGMSISDVFSKDQGCCCDLCSPLLALMSEARRLASAVFSPSCGSVANFLPCTEMRCREECDQQPERDPGRVRAISKKNNSQYAKPGRTKRSNKKKVSSICRLWVLAKISQKPRSIIRNVWLLGDLMLCRGHRFCRESVVVQPAD